MSLVSTLAKVAIGVAVAKGVGHMMKKRGAQTSSSPGSRSDGGLFGGPAAQSVQRESGGGLADMMGSILGGAKGAGGGGGIGGLLESLGGGRGGSGRSGGGLSDILGGLAGGSAGGGGGLGGLLGGLTGGSGGGLGGLGGLLGGLAGGMGAAASGRPGANDASFGDVLNSAFPQTDQPEIQPTPEQEIAAGLMLRAMIQAAKADGKLDDAEKAKLLERLGDVSDEEKAFIQEELRAPVDVDALARQTPEGLEPQLYAMSVMAIDLDSPEEAQYLHELAGALSLGPQEVNHIHAELGVPAIYR